MTATSPKFSVTLSCASIYLLLRGSAAADNGKVVKISGGELLETYDLTGMKLYETLLLSHDETRLFLFSSCLCIVFRAACRLQAISFLRWP